MDYHPPRDNSHQSKSLDKRDHQLSVDLQWRPPPPQVKQSQLTVGVSGSGFSLIYDKSLLLKQI